MPTIPPFSSHSFTSSMAPGFPSGITLSVTSGLKGDRSSFNWLEVSVCISAFTGSFRPLIPSTRSASKLPKWALTRRKPRFAARIASKTSVP
jgi:hypothetical protein